MKRVTILLAAFVVAYMMIGCYDEDSSDNENNGNDSENSEHVIKIISDDPVFLSATFLGRDGFKSINENRQTFYLEEFLIDDKNEIHKLIYKRLYDEPERGQFTHQFTLYYINGKDKRTVFTYDRLTQDENPPSTVSIKKEELSLTYDYDIKITWD